MLRYDSGDARFYSLMGEIEYRSGDKHAAARLFGHALGLSKTEAHALKRDILYAVESDRLPEAVAKIDVLLRRWPGLMETIAPLFPPILADARGYRAVLDALAAAAPWRKNLLRQLAKDPQGIDLADQLLFDLRETPLPPREDELAAVIASYVAGRRYDAAYRLFRSSLSATESGAAGYVYNGTFAAAATRKGRPFDWVLRDESGIHLTFGGLGGDGQGTSGATLRFLNRPLKGSPMQQNLLLPPGNFAMTLTASASELDLPRDLAWSVECLWPRRLGLAKLAIPAGTFVRQDVTARFSVPASDCAAQTLRLDTAAIAESWRYRNLGVLVMHGLRIAKVEP